MTYESESDSDADNNSHERRREINIAVRRVLKNWTSKCTTHGLENIAHQNEFILRLVWILATMASFIYMSITVVRLLNLYAEHRVLIKYETAVDSPVDFPAVTFCNLNPFDLTSDVSTGDFINKILIENNISPNLTLDEREKAIHLVEHASQILKANVIARLTMNSSQLENLGFTIDEMLISCYFNGIECNSTDFTWIRSFEHGNCYTFNGLKDSTGSLRTIKKTSKPGPTNGLRLELFLGVSGAQDYYTYNNGAYIVFHNQSTTVPSFKYSGVLAKTDHTTNILISRVFHHKLGSPFNDCRKNVDQILESDSDMYKETATITQYNQKLCFELCLQYKLIYPNCECYDGSIPQLNVYNLTLCSTKESLLCVERQRGLFDRQAISDLCLRDCPLECDTIEYKFETNEAIFPTNYYKTILTQDATIMDKFNIKNQFKPQRLPNSNVSNVSINNAQSPVNFHGNNNSNNNSIGGGPGGFSKLKGSVLTVYIYYQTLRHTRISQSELITFESLLGTVGGQIGLFMGASFLSFAEFMELIVDIVLEIRDRLHKLRIVNNFVSIEDVKY